MGRRWWLALGVLGLTVALVIPLTWWATQPARSVGTLTATPNSSPAATPAPASHHQLTGSPLPSSSRPARTAITGRAGRARLSIAALGINAPLVAVGVQPNGAMAIPAQVQDVGWYEFGAAPGAKTGSAVLAGHVDNAQQGKGALFTLGSIAVGTRVEVTLSSGQTLGYRVIGRELFAKRRLPTAQLFARTGPARLVIITCGGPFISTLSSYRDNLVVAAEPEPAG